MFSATVISGTGESSWWIIEIPRPSPVFVSGIFTGRPSRLIVPSSSACYRCYTLRRAANFPDRRVVPMLSAGAPLAVDAPAVDTMGLSWFVAGLAVEKVVERIALGDHSTMTRPGSFATVERAHPGIRVDEHRTLRVPRCPACSPRREFGLPQVWHHGGDGA